MEAVPRLPMLKVEIKELQEYGGMDWVDGSDGEVEGLRSSIKDELNKHIQENYSDDPGKYKDCVNSFLELQSSAYRAVKSPDFEGCNTLKKYYGQLHYMQSRFPFTGENAIKVSFVWGDAFTGSYTQHNSFVFEQTAILFNLGAIHSFLGSVDNRTSEEGTKVSCVHFQCAAGFFQYLADHLDTTLSPEISQFMLKLYTNTMLGQGQECLLEKSMQDNRKHSIIAKICQQVVDYYQQSLNSLSSSEAKDVMGDANRLWSKLLTFKVTFYSAIVKYYLGSDDWEQEQYGEGLSYLGAALDAYNDATKLAKNLKGEFRSKADDAIKYSADVFHGKHNSAKNDNDFIYHERVPDKATLTGVKGASLVKPLPFDPSNSAITGPDIFSKLVPLEAHLTASTYSEEKAKLLRPILAEVEEKDSVLEQYKRAIELDPEKLIKLDDEDRLEPALIEHCAALSVDQTPISALTKAMKELSDVFMDIDTMINDTVTLVNEEEKEVKQVKDLCGKTISSVEEVDKVKKELEICKDVQDKAGQMNDDLHTVMKTHIANLRIVSEGLLTLKKECKLSSTLELISEEDKEVITLIGKLCSKVVEMEVQRQSLVGQLRTQLEEDDVTAALMTKPGIDAEDLFQEELKKHDTVTGYIKQNLAAQENILTAVTEANVRYAKIRKVVDNHKEKVKSKCDNFLHSCKDYTAAVKRCEEGADFFKDLLGKVQEIAEEMKRINDKNSKLRKVIMDKHESKKPPPRPSAPKPKIPASKPDPGTSLFSTQELADLAADDMEEFNDPAFLRYLQMSGGLPPGMSLPSSAPRRTPLSNRPSPNVRLPTFSSGQGAQPLSNIPSTAGGRMPHSQLPAVNQFPDVAGNFQQPQNFAPSDGVHSQRNPMPPNPGYSQAGVPPHSMPQTAPPGIAIHGQSSLAPANSNYSQTNVPQRTMLPPHEQINSQMQPLVGQQHGNSGLTTQVGHMSAHQSTALGQHPIMSSQQLPSNYQQPNVQSQQPLPINQFPAQSPHASQIGSSGQPPVSHGYQPSHVTQAPSFSGVHAQANQYQQQQTIQPPANPVSSQSMQQIPTQPVNQMVQHPGHQMQQQGGYQNQLRQQMPHQQPVNQPPHQGTAPATQQPGYQTQLQPHQQGQAPNQPLQSPRGLAPRIQSPGSQLPLQHGQLQQPRPPQPTSNINQQRTSLYQPMPPQAAVLQQQNRPQVFHQQQSLQQSRQEQPVQQVQHHSGQYGQQQSVQHGQQQLNRPGQHQSVPYGQHQQPVHGVQQQVHGVQQPVLGGQQPVHGGQQPVHGGQQQSPHGGQQQPAYGGQQQPPHGGQQQPAYGGQQQPPHGGQQQPVYGGQQQPPHGGQQQPPHGGQQQPPHGGQQQPVYGGQQQPPHGGQQQPPHGGQQQPLHHSQQQTTYQMHQSPLASTRAPNPQAYQQHQTNQPVNQLPSPVQQTIVRPTAAPLRASVPPISAPLPNPQGYNQHPSNQASLPNNQSTSAQLRAPTNYIDQINPQQTSTNQPNPSAQPASHSVSPQHAKPNANTSSLPAPNAPSALPEPLNPSSVGAQTMIPPLEPMKPSDDLEGLTYTPSHTLLSTSSRTSADELLTASPETEVRAAQQQKSLLLPTKVESEDMIVTRIEGIPYNSEADLMKLKADTEAFQRHVSTLLAKSSGSLCQLDKDWKHLSELQEKAARKGSTAVGRCSSYKNRYQDILPFDLNRVVLNGSKDDYINASLVDGISIYCPRFIATQSPLPSSCADFWTMIHEQHVTVIVMLVGKNEIPKKCVKYWPDDRNLPQQHGPISITFTTSRSYATYVERNFTLKHAKSSLPRSVVQLQYTAWPEHGLHASYADLLSFIGLVYNFHNQQRSLQWPIVVHCENGVGHTGTFCSAFACTKHLDAGLGIPNILEVVEKMREKRKYIVQEKAQLKSLHDLVFIHASQLLNQRGVSIDNHPIVNQQSNHSSHVTSPPVSSKGDTFDVFGSAALSSIKASVEKMTVRSDKIPTPHLVEVPAPSASTELPKPDINAMIGSNVGGLDQAGTFNQPETPQVPVVLATKPDLVTSCQETQRVKVPTCEQEKPAEMPLITSISTHQMTINTNASNHTIQQPINTIQQPFNTIEQPITQTSRSSLLEQLTPESFTLGTEVKEKKRITKQDFFKPKADQFMSAKDNSDPFADLDPLWGLKK